MLKFNFKKSLTFMKLNVKLFFASVAFGAAEQLADLGGDVLMLG